MKTQIMYRANLSYTQLKEYLPLLLSSGLMTQTIVEGKNAYVVTVEGAGFLGGYRKLAKTLQGEPAKRKRKVKLFSNFQVPRAIH